MQFTQIMHQYSQKSKFDMDLEKLKYPVGRVNFIADYTDADVQNWIETIRNFPEQLKKEIEGLDEEQLAWIYRPEGWNIRQVVHHCADSHINAFNRIKRTLTEDTPEVMPYQEALYAELPDVLEMPLQPSLSILEGIHARWTKLFEQSDQGILDKAYFHMGMQKPFSMSKALNLYSWHCKHHLGHIKQAKAFQCKFK